MLAPEQLGGQVQGRLTVGGVMTVLATDTPEFMIML